jgi:hypothetical protein
LGASETGPKNSAVWNLIVSGWPVNVISPSYGIQIRTIMITPGILEGTPLPTHIKKGLPRTEIHQSSFVLTRQKHGRLNLARSKCQVA